MNRLKIRREFCTIVAVLALNAPAYAFANDKPADNSSVADLAEEKADALRRARPLHYAVTVEPDLANLTFKGQADITIRVDAPTRAITMHAKNLNFEESLMTGPSGTISLRISINRRFETVTFTPLDDSEIPAGQYVIKIPYRGVINSAEAKGIFVADGRGSFYDPNLPTDAPLTERQMFTHAQPNDARSIFPGWDEPAHKTPFDAAIILPENMTPVGNMPVAERVQRDDGRILTRFATTPAMSTYLLFFGAGNFKRISKIVDGIDYGVLTRASEGSGYDVALSSMQEITRFYSEYFGDRYPLPKMDLVVSAKPFGRFEAMENWGAILTNEQNTKFERYIGGGDTTAHVHYVNAHEISHQWIGNLLTPKSWDDLWLSEGLAVHLTDQYLHQKFPALRLDIQKYAQNEALFVHEIDKPSQPLISKKGNVYLDDDDFANVLYGKGGAVFSMIARALGPDKWRGVMRSYIAENKGKSVSADVLIAAVRATGDAQGAQAMDDFSSRPGFPLIAVDNAACNGDKTTLSLSQKPYPGATSAATANGAAQVWTVPLFIATANGQQVTYINQSQQNVTVPGCSAFTLNSAADGYYRADYSNVALGSFFADFAQLPGADQYGVLVQSFGNADAAVASFRPAFELLGKADTGALPELAGLSVAKLNLARSAFAGRKDAKLRAKLDRLIRRKLAPVLASRAPDSDENFGALGNFDAKLPEIRDLLDRAGDPEVRNDPQAILPEKGETFRLLFNPAAKSFARIAFRNLDAAAWQAFVDGLDRNSIVGLDEFIGVNKDPAIAEKALIFALTGDMETYSRSTIFNRTADEWPGLVVNRLLNDPRSKTILDEAAMTEIAAAAAAKITDAADASRLAAYASMLPEGKPKADLVEALMQSKLRLASLARMRAELKIWINAPLRR